MAGKEHSYVVDVRWTPSTDGGTSDYAAYDRSHDVVVAGKPVIAGSADPAFRGDPARHNPEELLVAALSECHMLSYLSVAALSGVTMLSYVDSATGVMRETPGGAGEFVDVLLRPTVTVADPGMVAKAEALHEKAHSICFIARSVNFPVRNAPTIHVAT